jgi:hypothetical protein
LVHLITLSADFSLTVLNTDANLDSQPFRPFAAYFIKET